MNTSRPPELSNTNEAEAKHLGRFLVEEFATSTADQPQSLLVYFKSRWGEVDGYLPIIHKFRETHPDWRIIAVIGSERLANTADAQAFLLNELKQSVDVLIRLAPKPPKASKQIFYQKWATKLTSKYHRKCVRLSWRKIFKYLSSKEIRLIFKDHGHDDPFLLRIQAMFDVKCVSAPHGTGIYVKTADTSHLKKQNAQVDLFLAGDETEVPIFKIFMGGKDTANIQVVGRPRYDRWRIEHLVQLPCFLSSDEYNMAQNNKRVFLFATRGPSSSFFPTSVFEYLIKSVAETVLSQPGNLLLIKPHPAQDLDFIKSTLADYPSDSWKISSLQTMQLASISDFVICMLSSVILDALAVGKPTVEFFQYVKRQHVFLKDEQDRTVSAYTHLGLTIAVDQKEELQYLIEDYFKNDGSSDCWKKQRERTKEFMKLDNNSSLRTVTEIDRLLESGSTT